MNKLEKSAITLVINPEEKIENRVFLIVDYLDKTYLQSQWIITEIDATGLLGNCLTHTLNNQQNTTIYPQQFLQILQENGQILDLEATLIKNPQAPQDIITIIIRDGYSVDILGYTELLPVNVLKDFISVDPHLFDSEETDLNVSEIQPQGLYSQITQS
jgi:hypothetical protein